VWMPLAARISAIRGPIPFTYCTAVEGSSISEMLNEALGNQPVRGTRRTASAQRAPLFLEREPTAEDKWLFCCFLSFAVSKPTIVNFVQSLIAVLAGNAVYFLLMPHLPPPARHDPARLDLGMLVDFWICVVFLGAIKTFTKRGRRSSEQR